MTLRFWLVPFDILQKLMIILFYLINKLTISHRAERDRDAGAGTKIVRRGMVPSCYSII